MLDQQALSTIIAESTTLDSAEHPLRHQPVSLLDHWRSRTGDFYHCRLADVEDRQIVVKLTDDSQEVRCLYQAMLQLSRLFPAGCSYGSYAPQPFSYHTDPPALIMRFIEGSDLHRILRDPEHQLWQSGGPEIQGLINSCGKTLGRYHTVHQVSDGPGAPEARDAAHRRLARVGRGAKAPIARRIEGIFDRLPVVVSYGDFAPYNLRVTSRGELVLLDPVDDRSINVVHKDISWFIFELDRAMTSRRSKWTKRSQRQQWTRQLVEDFLAGYTATGPLGALEPEDYWCLGLYQTHRSQRAAYKRWRDRRYRESARYFARAAEGWVRLALPLPQSVESLV